MNFRKTAMLTGVLLVALTSGAMAANITSEDWGATTKGEKVKLYTLTGAGGMVVKISDFGARVVELHVPDAHGGKKDVVLGYPSVAGYDTPVRQGIFSALIGPYTNRLGISFKVAGQTYRQTQTPSQPGADSIGHSGEIGFHKRMWEGVMHDGAEPSLALTIKDPDGLGGFPGNVSVTVTFTVRRDNTLALDYRGTTNKPTVLNLTDHFYFALNGEGSGKVDNEIVTMYSSQYTPDYAKSAVGTVAPVKGTIYDFTTPTRWGDQMAKPETGRGYTVNMLVDGTPGKLRPASRIEDPSTGIVMEIYTTQPAVQLYTDQEGPFNGKNGHIYNPHEAIVIETQHYPDSPNHPEFPSTEVTPDKPFHEVAEYRFSVKK